MLSNPDTDRPIALRSTIIVASHLIQAYFGDTFSHMSCFVSACIYFAAQAKTLSGILDSFRKVGPYWIIHSHKNEFMD